MKLWFSIASVLFLAVSRGLANLELSVEVDNEIAETNPVYIRPSTKVLLKCTLNITPSNETSEDGASNSSASNSSASNKKDTVGQIVLVSTVNNSDVSSTASPGPLQYILKGTGGDFLCKLVSADSNTPLEESNVHQLVLRDVVVDPLPNVYLDQPVSATVTVRGGNNTLSCEKSASVMSVSEEGGTVEYQVNFTATSPQLICQVVFTADSQTIKEPINVNVIEPKWSDWESGSEECLVLLDNDNKCGKKNRRKCENQNPYSGCPGLDYKYTLCNADDCQLYIGDWSNWGPCALTSGPCQRKRTRHCIPAYNSSKSCDRVEVEGNEKCKAEICDKWSDWSSWGECEAKHNSCIQRRFKTCQLPDGLRCAGDNSDSKECLYENGCEPEFRSSNRTLIWKSYYDAFTLICDPEPSPETGFGDMAIKWQLNSVTIVSQFVRITKEGFSDEVKYVGRNLDTISEGLYQCCVRNSFGETCNQGWDVRLLDHGPVINPYIEEIREARVRSKGSNITLGCPYIGHKLAFQWYFQEVEIPNATESSYTIYLMSKEKEGFYYCCADEIQYRKSQCSAKYEVIMLSDEQQKYLILIVCLVLIILLALIFIIICCHCNKMDSFKRRFRVMFERNHVKLYNGMDPFNNDIQMIQRSQSYLKRLSKSKPLSKEELKSVIANIETNNENVECPENTELGIEYNGVPNNFITITKTPVGTENKNRYINVLPNPHSRVILDDLEGDPTSNYINANYVRGYKLVPNCYIATQGPIPSTTLDFWRLVWQEDCRSIVMTTGLVENNKVKCNLYFPTIKDSRTLKLDNFEVELKAQYPSCYYTVSIFEVEKTTGVESEKRTLYHFWYHSWPDFGVPDDTGPFLDFVEFVRCFKSVLSDAPVLTHCSAGIGRTGTFIAVNLGIEQFHDTGKVDPLGYICQLRQDRGGMIQTLDQYTFVHRALQAYQARLSERDKESKDLLSLRFGPPSLTSDTEYLPAGLTVPVIRDTEGSKVEQSYIDNLTASIRPNISRYSDSASSLNSIKGSSESLNRIKKLASSSSTVNVSNAAASKPLLKKPETKPKRRNKVKSLFFPSPTKSEKRYSSSSIGSFFDGKKIKGEQRSLSLNNVKTPNSTKSSIASSSRKSSKSSTVEVNINDDS